MEAVSVNVICCGRRHTVGFNEKGRLFTAHHHRPQLELAAHNLGAELPRCLRIKEAIRKMYGLGFYYTDEEVPKPLLNYIRATFDNRQYKPKQDIMQRWRIYENNKFSLAVLPRFLTQVERWIFSRFQPSVDLRLIVGGNRTAYFNAYGNIGVTLNNKGQLSRFDVSFPCGIILDIVKHAKQFVIDGILVRGVRETYADGSCIVYGTSIESMASFYERRRQCNTTKTTTCTLKGYELTQQFLVRDRRIYEFVPRRRY